MRGALPGSRVVGWSAGAPAYRCVDPGTTVPCRPRRRCRPRRPTRRSPSPTRFRRRLRGRPTSQTRFRRRSSSGTRKILGRPLLPGLLCPCRTLRILRSAVVELAGFAVSDEDVLELAGLLQSAGYDETADRLTYALKWGDELVGLRIADRLAILDVLDDAPDGLAGCGTCSPPNIGGGSVTGSFEEARRPRQPRIPGMETCQGPPPPVEVPRLHPPPYSRGASVKHPFRSAAAGRAEGAAPLVRARPRADTCSRRARADGTRHACSRPPRSCPGRSPYVPTRARRGSGKPEAVPLPARLHERLHLAQACGLDEPPA